MKKVSKLIVTGKIILSVILGSLITIAIIALLDIWADLLQHDLGLWVAAGILTVSVFGFAWLLLRKPSYINIETEGIDDLPAAAVELIDDIIKSMRYRKSAAADVRQELADHFIDALRECKTEVDKNECITEMAAGFGDPKVLGVLARRGKKRCRPMWQKVLASIPLLLVYSALLLVLYVGWFFTGKPAVTTDYLAKWNQQVRPVADDDDNAEPFYSKAVEVYNADAIKPVEDSDGDKFYKSPRSLSSLSEEELVIVNRWLADNKGVLEFIRQGNAKPYYWRDYATPEEGSTVLMAILLPHLSEYRQMVYLLCWQAILQAGEGQMDEAFETLNQTFIFGSHLHNRKTTLIEQIVAIAMKRISNETRRIILADNFDKLDEQILAKAAKQFEQTIANANFRVDYSGGQMLMRDEIQRSFVESKFGRDHLYLPRLNILSGNELMPGLLTQTGLKVLFAHPDKKETLKSVDQFYATLSKLADKTPASLRAAGDPMDQLIEDICRENIFLGIMMPALWKVSILSYRNRIETEATFTIMAAVLYYKQNSQYPENLQVLVDSGLLSAIPIDPFSDRPLAYKKTGDGFMLYSYGMNMVDDGGVQGTDDKHKRIWADEGDAIFWPTEISDQ